jgi:hypothetical protein
MTNMTNIKNELEDIRQEAAAKPPSSMTETLPSEAQEKIHAQLRACYARLLSEPLPGKFKELLKKLENS